MGGELLWRCKYLWLAERTCLCSGRLCLAECVSSEALVVLVAFCEISYFLFAEEGFWFNLRCAFCRCSYESYIFFFEEHTSHT